MTDIDHETSEWEAEYARQNELVVEANAHNREVLFAALSAAGVREVIVKFHESDEGWIQSVTAYAEGGDELPLSETRVTIQTIIRSYSEPWRLHEETTVLANAIEIFCLDYLDQAREEGAISDDEGDGAFGTFEFGVAKKSITLDYNWRTLVTENFEF